MRQLRPVVQLVSFEVEHTQPREDWHVWSPTEMCDTIAAQLKHFEIRKVPAQSCDLLPNDDAAIEAQVPDRREGTALYAVIAVFDKLSEAIEAARSGRSQISCQKRLVRGEPTEAQACRDGLGQW